MLDKMSSKILKKLIEIDRDNKNKYLPGSEGLSRHFPDYIVRDIDDSLHIIANRGYVDLLIVQDTVHNVKSISPEGKRYFEFNWLETKKFLFSSVLVPVVVAGITTVVTILIKWFLTGNI